MKLNKIFYVTLIVSFAVSFGCMAQVKPKPLKIGDKCPDELLEYLYDQPGVHRQKAIVVGFWATWCAPCLSAIPLLDSLQMQYRDELAILSVTYEHDTIVNEVLDKVFRGNPYSVTVLTNNKILAPYFPHQTVPHYVWIDTNGIVQAITSDKESLKNNLIQFLSGQSLTFQMKTERIKYDGKTPLYGSGIAKAGKELIYHSMVTGYRPDLPFKFVRGSYFITCINSSIVRLYQFSYGKFDLQYLDMNRVIVTGLETTQDSVELGIFTSKKLVDLYKQSRESNAYTYELMVPDSSYTFDELFSIMQQDLNRFFYSKGLEGRLEKKTRQILALSVINKKKFDAACNGESTPGIYNTSQSLKITNQPVSYFLSQLMPFVENVNIPVVNKTNYTGMLNLELNGNLSDMATLNKELEQYGLKFIQKKEKIDMIVISKNKR